MRTLLLSLLATAGSVLSQELGAPDAGKTPANLITPPGPIVNSAQYALPATAKYDYADVLHKSYLFYWAQRSGKLPYQRLAWRSDSCLDCKGTYGEDLSGAWYEAANTMKWGGPLAFSIGQLAWNVWEYPDTYKHLNEYREGVEWVRHGADYLVNTYTAAEGEERLVGLFGDSAALVGGKIVDIDFGYFGPPEEYAQWAPEKFGRHAYYCIGSATVKKGCSDIAGDYAAALAAASVVMKPMNQTLANKYLETAQIIYQFGTRYLGSYNSTAFNEQGWVNYKEWYPSSGYQDELGLAATWLYIATNDTTYLTAARTYLAAAEFPEYSWADKGIAAAIILNRVAPTPDLVPKIQAYFQTLLPGGNIKRTPRGLAYIYKWGSLRYAANAAFVALVHAKDTKDAAYATTLRTFAAQQINYILGDCGRSWVVGFGTNSPKLPYHKSSYNSYINYPLRGQPNGVVGDDFLHSATPNRFILYGALVGGPEDNDGYVDTRADYVYTEVTQDYNAAFTGALAGLVDFYGREKFKGGSDCGLDLGWGNANATYGKPEYKDGDCYHLCGECKREVMDVVGGASAGVAGPVVGGAGNSSGDAKNGEENRNKTKDNASGGMSNGLGVGAFVAALIGGALWLF